MAKMEIPDWVTETLPEHLYQLVLFENGDSGAEEIDMTRTEYIALKVHLAAMRGYGIDDVQARVREGALQVYGETSTVPDAQQGALQIEEARRVYRLCPDLVVFESAELDKHLEELTA